MPPEKGIPWRRSVWTRGIVGALLVAWALSCGGRRLPDTYAGYIRETCSSNARWVSITVWTGTTMRGFRVQLSGKHQLASWEGPGKVLFSPGGIEVLTDDGKSRLFKNDRYTNDLPSSSEIVEASGISQYRFGTGREMSPRSLHEIFAGAAESPLAECPRRTTSHQPEQ